MQNHPLALPVSGESSRGVLTIYRIAACLFGGWITWLLLVPDPYATTRALEPLRQAKLNGYFIHFSVFTLVSTFMLSSLRKRGSLVWSTLVVLLLGHACLTEILQMGVPGRTADVWDALANISGIATGTIIDYRLRQLFSGRWSLASIFGEKLHAPELNTTNPVANS